MGLSGHNPPHKLKSICRVNLTHFLETGIRFRVGWERREVVVVDAGVHGPEPCLGWRHSLPSCPEVGWESSQHCPCRIALWRECSWRELHCPMSCPALRWGDSVHPMAGWRGTQGLALCLRVGHLCRVTPAPELPMVVAEAFVPSASKSNSLSTQSCFTPPTEHPNKGI